MRLAYSDPVETEDAEDESTDRDLLHPSFDPPYSSIAPEVRGITQVGDQDNIMNEMELRIDDLSHPAVQDLLAFHFGDMRSRSPDGAAHVLDLDRLREPGMTFWTAWKAGELLGCGALRELTRVAGEIKSMRTHPQRLRMGAARAILACIIEAARERGYERLSLETGSGPVFDAAVELYESFGFQLGAAFAEYQANDFSRFFHLDLPTRS